MLYAGVDSHKRHSQAHVIDEHGHRRARARLANGLVALRGLFAALGEPTRAVVDADWNWGVMYDWLDAIGNVAEVDLRHPYQVRAIAPTQVKTDAINSHILARLLWVNLIPRAPVLLAAHRFP
jgi:transposase